MLISTEAELQAMLRRLHDAPWFVIDTETTGLSWRHDRAVGIALADKDEAWYVPLNEEAPAWNAAVVSGLRPPLLDRHKVVGGHNIVFDLHFLANLGLEVRTTIVDSMQMAHLWEENLAESGAAKLLSLKTLVPRILGVEMPTWEEAFAGKTLEEQAEYAARDARVTYDLIDWLARALGRRVWYDAETMFDYYMEMLSPLLPVVFSMERKGMRIDVGAVQEFAAATRQKMDTARQAALAIAPAINIDSPSQVGEWLVGHGVKLPKTPSGQTSTAEQDLLEAAKGVRKQEVVDFINAVLEYRANRKLLTTYISNPRSESALLDVVDDEGRIHPRWNYTGTVSGRFSCSNPNLQNIPRDPTIRNWFVAAPGHKLVVADLSQAEVRMMAALSQDAKLIAALEAEDIHSEIGSEVFGVPVSKKAWYIYDGERYDGPYVDEECARANVQLFDGTVVSGSTLRSMAKTVVFGIMYGRGANAIAEAFGLSKSEAQAVIDRLFSRFPGVKKWIQDTHTQAVRTGVVRMAYGRTRRPILLQQKPATYGPEQEIYVACYAAEMRKPASARSDDAAGLTERGKRQAVNSVIQGSVAEVMAQALVALKDWGVVAQVHDEIVLEVPAGRAEEAARAVADAMQVTLNGVFFPADVHIVDRWGEAKE